MRARSSNAVLRFFELAAGGRKLVACAGERLNRDIRRLLQLSGLCVSRLGLLAHFKFAGGLRGEFRMLLEQTACSGELFQFRQFAADKLVGFGFLSLAPGEVELALNFAQYIVDSREVLAHAFQFALADLAAPLEQREPSRLLDHRTQFSRFGLDYLVDASLLDERVAAAMDLRGHEKLGNILEAAGNPVDQIFRVTRTINPACDRDFAQCGIRFGQRTAFLGLQQERNFSHARGLVGIIAGVNEVFGTFAAKSRRRLLAKHPAYRVDDVRFAAAVGADDGGHTGTEADYGRLEEGLEAY